MKKVLLTLLMVVGIGGMQNNYAAKSAPCKCYCAVKCGPRDMKPGDRPRNVKVKIKDRQGKIVERNAVFCADRDEEIYKKHPHKCKITEEVLEQLTCVPQQAPCKCYCAVKCGPRDMKSGDKPRNVKVKIKDRQGKIVERNAVFCADRDEEIYKKHPHKCKITEEVLEQLTCVPKN